MKEKRRIIGSGTWGSGVGLKYMDRALEVFDSQGDVLVQRFSLYSCFRVQDLGFEISG